MQWIRSFQSLSLADLPLVGGKNASLGEMCRELAHLGIMVPDGFAITAEAYLHFLDQSYLEKPIREALAGITTADVTGLRSTSRRIHNLILSAQLPDDLIAEIASAYDTLAATTSSEAPYVAVRSSATAEDLPSASFAGQHESYLNIHGKAEVAHAVKQCFASLFTARAISYRRQRGFDQLRVALSVGVQLMVRSDRASAGVIFTLDTESGFRDLVLISSAWGFGEGVVQGRVNPDEIYVHKPTLEAGFSPILRKRIGSKESTVVYDESGHRLKTVSTPLRKRDELSLGDDDALQLARWAVQIEKHYSSLRGRPTPMDLEWAKDGDSGQLFIVQARPETVHSQKAAPMLVDYELKELGPVLCEGMAVGEAIATGVARVISSPNNIDDFSAGEILITTITDPDWEPVMKIASAVVTERGGRTSHAAIVAREIGIPAVVGASSALASIRSGQEVTISCAEGEVGHVYEGKLAFDKTVFDPKELPTTRTKILLNMGQPDKAFRLALLPSDGVGLARMEFIFASWVGVHPMALLRYDRLPNSLKRRVDIRSRGSANKAEFFIDRLSQGIAMIAGAFYPRPVMLRLSDFKSNEYAGLVGGELFESKEANPMLGWRGASRYTHPEYKEAFLLEVAAIRRVRERMGLKNLKVLVPFCRTPEEGAAVLKVAREGGLRRGHDGLEIHVMAELPSNILLADRFAELFDGFSIGTNDLTQLILGVDRDSERLASLFEERNEAVRRACALLIKSAHKAGRPVGICGQAPSDSPDFAAFLVECGIDSISLSADALIASRFRIAECERQPRGAFQTTESSLPS